MNRLIEKKGKRVDYMDKYHTIKQVAAHLEVNHKTVRKLIKSGKLEAIKLGKVYRISETAISRYHDQEKVSKPPPVKVPVPRRRRGGGFKYF
ncbi:MAG: helix-turn-helix domain-containing protein [Gemmataceae bacterium]